MLRRCNTSTVLLFIGEAAALPVTVRHYLRRLSPLLRYDYESTLGLEEIAQIQALPFYAQPGPTGAPRFMLNTEVRRRVCV